MGIKMSRALQFELSGIRDKLERGDPESVAVALTVVDRLLAGIADDPEEHLRKLRKELADLDVALAMCDHKAVKQGSGEWVDFYLLPCGPWHRMLALRQNVVALSGALTAGHPTMPCSTCHCWMPVVMGEVEDGRVTLRCPDGHEQTVRVVALPEDMRGETALRYLPGGDRG